MYCVVNINMSIQYLFLFYSAVSMLVWSVFSILDTNISQSEPYLKYSRGRFRDPDGHVSRAKKVVRDT